MTGHRKHTWREDDGVKACTECPVVWIPWMHPEEPADPCTPVEEISVHDWREDFFTKDMYCAHCPAKWHLGQKEPQTLCATNKERAA